MTRWPGLVALLAFVCSGCVSSEVVLHVASDYSGKATMTSRVFMSSVAAIDSLLSAGVTPGKPPTVEELLPAPSQGALDRAFGTPVLLESSALEKAADGGIRRTVVDFSDVRKLRLVFPPAFAVSQWVLSFSGVGDAPVITFSVKPHENGDELLLVKMPEPAVRGDPTGPVTTFETGSPEEQAFKRGIKGLALTFVVETEQPILRTNAPKMSEGGATILALDLDKMINAMDEALSRRLLGAGSFQEVLWQLGDLPGASIPVDHEVFIEYEPAQRPKAQTPAPAAAQTQAPPDTEIYLAPLKNAGGTLTVGTPENITKNAGYDNQPFFTPQGSILYTSMRNGAAQTDIYRYDIASGRTLQVIGTPESEYSPTVTPLGALSVVRVELDGHNTQRLWQFTADGREPRVLLPDVKPVGYHAWADDHTLVLFILGASRAPATLQIADTATGASRLVATDVGRSIQRMPGGSGAAHISFVQRERDGDGAYWTVKELDPATGAIAPLAPAIDRDAADLDTAWTPDGTLLAARGGTLYAWRRGDSGWKEVASLERLGLRGVTRLAVSPKGDWLALVGLPATPPRAERSERRSASAVK